ncbi:trigger factor [Weissella paramesenteroides]|uniref:trigger factor n=1 Tax=Weissella paramesenteroides TaxID=1249 RepID=UPI002072A571|nr:trigger factor [Weissella paramesenteroides]MCM6765816.1 trigger factor [Weissella paramesenteroides]MCM6767188.1 trigger factor [Weissella paramesenteroides]MCM6769490.1 trigger factor [Weissella paramesenteroides]MCM6771049.1 trigger factor [Weissella paramesenteroides]MCM6779859.1 trigger factor [Weissella paramesenteroides]
MANAVFTKGEGNKGTIKFEVPVDVYAKGIDAAFNEVKKQISVPGFRKGKMPKQVFFQMYGEESLYQDALNKILPDVYGEAVSETGAMTVGQPKIEAESMNKGETWVLTAEVELAPEIELGQYKGVEVPASDTSVSDADVDEELANMQQGQSELVLVEEAAKNGDTVVIDFDGSVDGVHFDGGQADNYSLELGSGSFIPGFEEQLVGAKAEDKVNVKVTFPEDYQAADLAGKEAVFEVTVHEVKTKEVPALDDEFAKDVDEEVETLAELKEKVKARLADQKASAAKEAKEDAAVAAAVDNAKVVGDEIPASMIDEDVHRQMNQMFASMQQQGISPELYYQITGTSEDDLHKQYEEGAERRVKTNLVLEAIVKAEDIKPSDEEIAAEVKSLAEAYNMEEDAVRNALSDDMLSHDIAIKSVVDLIVAEAVEA